MTLRINGFAGPQDTDGPGFPLGSPAYTGKVVEPDEDLFFLPSAAQSQAVAGVGPDEGDGLGRLETKHWALIIAAVGFGIAFLTRVPGDEVLRRRRENLRGLGFGPETHTKRAKEDGQAVMSISKEVQGWVKRGSCKDAWRAYKHGSMIHGALLAHGEASGKRSPWVGKGDRAWGRAQAAFRTKCVG